MGVSLSKDLSSVGFDGCRTSCDVGSFVTLSCWRANVWGVEGASRGDGSINTRIGLVWGPGMQSSVQSSFACFFSGCAYNILHDFGECCESVPLDHTGSYISSSINITKILACVVQVDAFYCKSLNWLHLHCNGSWFSSKLCISCVELEY